MEKRKNDDDLIKDQINALIKDEIQETINEYIDTTDELASQGFGITRHGKDEKLKVNISKEEVDRLIKEYKKLKKYKKSNLAQIEKLGLVDKNGNPLK